MAQAPIPGSAFIIDTCSNPQLLLNRLAKSAIPRGVTIGAMSVIGRSAQMGLYQNFPVGLGELYLDDGVVFSSGPAQFINNVRNPIVSNQIDRDDPSIVPAFQRQEIIDIARATAGIIVPDIEYDVYDLASHKISFTTDSTVKSFSLDFIYGSQEYPDFLLSKYNDLFLIFLDGRNIAKDERGKAISVGNNFFKVPNIRGLDTSNFINPAIHINAFTPPLRAQDNLSPGQHTLEFVIVDIGDTYFNSSVFLANFQFRADTLRPGVILNKDFIADQKFSVLETLQPGAEVGMLATLVPKDSLTFSKILGPAEIALDPKTGQLTLAQGASLAPFRNQTLVLRVVAKKGTLSDTAKVEVFVIPVRPGAISVSKALYLDSTGNGRIDQAWMEFPSRPSETPKRIRLRDPFAAGGVVEVAGAQIVRIDSTHYRADFLDREFTYGTGVPVGNHGTILESDSVFTTTPFPIGDGVGPLPTGADAVLPRKAGEKATLAIPYSEAVGVDLNSAAFPYDVKRAGQVYAAAFVVESVKDLGGNKFLYTFSSPDYPMPGDSLRLKFGSPLVGDLAGNRSRMSFYIPVTGKIPVPPVTLQLKLSGLVASPSLAAVYPLANSVILMDASQPGVCVSCSGTQSLAFQQLLAGQKRPGFQNNIMSIKISAPTRYNLNIFNTLGEIVNQASGEIGEADLQKLVKDAEGNYVLKFYWWPVSTSGRKAATGAYVAQGSITTQGTVEPAAGLEAGYKNLTNGGKNISFIFGTLHP